MSEEKKEFKMSPELQAVIVQLTDIVMKVYELGMKEGVDMYLRILKNEVEA